MTSGVYLIQCKANDTFYVGEASNIERRVIREHFKRLKDGRHENGRLQAAWEKYGPESFAWKIVFAIPFEVCEQVGQDALSVLTKRMEATIGFAMIQEGFRLFNIAGFDQWSKPNPSFNPLVRLAQAEAARSRWANESARKHISDVISGRKPKAGPKPPKPSGSRSASVKKSWADPVKRERRMLSIANRNHPRAKAIRCIDTGEVFPSVYAASVAKGVPHRGTGIVRAIRLGQRCCGLAWEYAT